MIFIIPFFLVLYVFLKVHSASIVSTQLPFTFLLRDIQACSRNLIWLVFILVQKTFYIFLNCIFRDCGQTLLRIFWSYWCGFWITHSLRLTYVVNLLCAGITKGMLFLLPLRIKHVSDQQVPFFFNIFFLITSCFKGLEVAVDTRCSSSCEHLVVFRKLPV